MFREMLETKIYIRIGSHNDDFDAMRWFHILGRRGSWGGGQKGEQGESFHQNAQKKLQFLGLHHSSKYCSIIHFYNFPPYQAGCSQVCTKKGDDYLCGCSEGYVLQEDGKSCTAGMWYLLETEDILSPLSF